MIHKIHICIDDKLILNKFSINIHENQIIINSLDNKNGIIKIAIYNKYNGIDYFPICFPLKMIIINDSVFNPYNHHLYQGIYMLLTFNDIKTSTSFISVFDISSCLFSFYIWIRY